MNPVIFRGGWLGPEWFARGWFGPDWFGSYFEIRDKIGGDDAPGDYSGWKKKKKLNEQYEKPIGVFDPGAFSLLRSMDGLKPPKQQDSVLDEDEEDALHLILLTL